MSYLFAWGGQSTGVSASMSVLPINTQDWSPLRWTRWISLQSKGFSSVFSNTTVQKHQFFGAQLSLQSNSHIHTGETIALTRPTCVGKLTSFRFFCIIHSSFIYFFFKDCVLKAKVTRTSKTVFSFFFFPLMVQWLGLSAFIAVALGSIFSQGTKILQAMWLGQKKIFFFLFCSFKITCKKIK